MVETIRENAPSLYSLSHAPSHCFLLWPYLDGHNLWQLLQRLRARGAGGQAAEEAGHVLYAERPHVHGERLRTQQGAGGRAVSPWGGGGEGGWLLEWEWWEGKGE